MKVTGIIFLLLSLLCVLSCGKSYSGKKKPVAVKGVLDLKDWNFEKDGIVDLNGKWKFYWNTFIPPSEINNLNDYNQQTYLIVPDCWNRYKVNNIEIPIYGYGTYYLRLLLPEDKEGLAIKVHDIAAAYRLYINNNLIGQKGIPGKSREETKWLFSPDHYRVESNNNTLDIILHVSNFHDKDGGIIQRITLGREKIILKNRFILTLLDFFLFGSILIIGLYHIIIFLLRRKETNYFIFGTFCIIMSIRCIITGERIFTYLFPEFPFYILYKIDMLTIYTGFPLFGLYFSKLFEKDSPDYLLKIFYIIIIIFPPIVILTQETVYAHILPIYHIMILFLTTLILIIMFLAIYRKREGSIIFTAGALFLIFAVINDFLYGNKIIQSIMLTSYGLFIFFFSQAYILSSRFSKSFQANEKLTVELNELNLDLENKVDERTRNLEEANNTIRQQNRKLAAAYKRVEEMSLTDSLTGLHNRRWAARRLEEELTRYSRNRKPFTLIIADIDNFKNVNDTHGHDCGDYVLNSLAQKISAKLRKVDCIIRWGGEEFLIILPETDGRSAITAAEKIRKEIEASHFIYHGITIALTMTFGIAEYRESLTLNECLKFADEALFKGKLTGKNRVILSEY